MPQLIKNINGLIYTPIGANIKAPKNINGDIQQEDYINIYGFTAFLQLFSKIEDTSKETTPLLFGLNNNLVMKTIYINF